MKIKVEMIIKARDALNEYGWFIDKSKTVLSGNLSFFGLRFEAWADVKRNETVRNEQIS